ncbi:MAG: FeoA family protein [Lentisphaerota bacterium]
MTTSSHPQQAPRHPGVTLTDTRPGQRIRVIAVDAGQALVARLCALGLTPGITAEVVAVGAGPVVLNVMGSRIVLGHGMADQVRVRPAPPAPPGR